MPKKRNQKTQNSSLKVNDHDDLSDADDETASDGRYISLDVVKSSDDDGEDSGESDDEESDAPHGNNNSPVNSDDEDDLEEDSSVDTDADEEREDAIDTAWGRSSSQYYAADTADLEIGQNFQESKEEEEIAKRTLAKRRKAEQDSDYMIGSTAETLPAPASVPRNERVPKQFDISKLSPSEVSEILNRESPEMLGLLSELQLKLNELSLLGLAVDEAHTHQSSWVTESQLSYLELRQHLLLSYVMNVNMYLLLKTEAAEAQRGRKASTTPPVDVRQHPVVDQLLKLQRALDKLKPLEKDGRRLVSVLVQRAAEEVLESAHEEDGSESDGDVSGEDDEEEEVADSDSGESIPEGHSRAAAESDPKDLAQRTSAVLAQAKEKSQVQKASAQSKKQKVALLGCEVGDVEQHGSADTPASKLQASYNTLIQKHKSAQKASVLGGDFADIPVESEGRQRPQKAVVGSLEATEDLFDEATYQDHEPNSKDEEYFGGSLSDDDFPALAKSSNGKEDSDDEFVKFYNELSSAGAAKSAKRKNRYSIAPRVAGGHVTEVAPEAKRAASYQIIKNRGLVASKAKINRNPRVKKKEQFRKASIARKGQVREIRDREEGAQYGGEATGIKSNISRSRKITN